MRWRVLLLLLASFLLLLVGGGAVFHFLETRHEQQVRVASAQYLDAVLADKQCLSRADLEALVRVVLTAYDQGVRADAAGTNVTVAGASAAESATNWDFASSVFFAGTVATTIGYGHIAPATPGGRAFCAVFALAAIPLCLVLLAAIGDKLKAAYGRAHRTLTHRCANRLCADVLRTALVSSAGLVVFLFLPSAVFVAIEGWTYGEALYYSFVTLTTIGFGDFVVGTNRGQQYRTLYRLCAWLWILAGLAWLSVIISLVQDVYQGVLDRVEERVDGGGQDMALLERKKKRKRNPENACMLNAINRLVDWLCLVGKDTSLRLGSCFDQFWSRPGFWVWWAMARCSVLLMRPCLALLVIFNNIRGRHVQRTIHLA